MKKIISFLLGLAGFLVIGCDTSSKEASYRQINMDEAMTMMEEESGYIIPTFQMTTLEELQKKYKVIARKD